jgi:hypothetical protein
MRPFMVMLLLANLGLADTITFRDGRSINGSYLGGDSRTVRVAVGDRIDTYPVDQISGINFAAPAAAVAATPAPPPPPVPADRDDRPRLERRDVARDLPPPPPPPARNVPPAAQLSSGTVLTVRMIDGVDSERDRVGQTFKASLDEPVVDSRGVTLIPRGADVVVKLVDDKESGKLAGRTILTLDLVSVNVNGREVDVNTETVSQQSDSRTARSGKVIGGTAALGAIIGAIAGGGKGAAIGAGAGAGVGAAAQVATKGQRVRIPSETRLTFTLQQALQL